VGERVPQGLISGALAQLAWPIRRLGQEELAHSLGQRPLVVALRVRVALHQQHLGPVGRVTQHDQRRRDPRRGDLALVPFLARPGPL